MGDGKTVKVGDGRTVKVGVGGGGRTVKVKGWKDSEGGGMEGQ